MSQKHDLNQPIEVLIDKIEDAIDCVDEGNAQFALDQVFNTS